MNFVSVLIMGLWIITPGLAVSFSALSSVSAAKAPTEFISLLQPKKLLADEHYNFQQTHTRFSLLQITRILELTTFFENSKIQADYEYIENLGDGRGYTAGRIGFCTGTGDLVEVVDSYCMAQPKSRLCAYRTRLHEISNVADANQQPNPDVRGLDRFDEAWGQASKDQNFRRQQDQALIEMYFTPALKYFKQQNLKWPASLSVLYDTFIQHGEEGPDGFKFIFDKTNRDLKGLPVDERRWINQFLQNRIQILLNPSNHDTADEWRESVDRAYKLLNVINDDRNKWLNRPVRFNHEVTTD